MYTVVQCKNQSFGCVEHTIPDDVGISATDNEIKFIFTNLPNNARLTLVLINNSGYSVKPISYGAVHLYQVIIPISRIHVMDIVKVNTKTYQTNNLGSSLYQMQVILNL